MVIEQKLRFIDALLQQNKNPRKKGGVVRNREDFINDVHAYRRAMEELKLTVMKAQNE